MTLVINGKEQEFSSLEAGAPLSALIEHLALKGDRVAVEQNGSIVPRAEWENTQLSPGDKLEVVHFVGGGSGVAR